MELCDGSGDIHQAELVDVGEKVLARIVSSCNDPADGRPALWVAQGLLKPKTMDTVVQKCTELGVAALIPVITSRCQGRPDADREEKRHQRWTKIIEASCKQCRRTRPMELREVMDFKQAITAFGQPASGLNILFWEEEKRPLRQLAPFAETGAVRLLLGPEGGFSREEVDLAREAGWQTASLGRRILRAETATLATVAIMQYLLGVMS